MSASGTEGRASAAVQLSAPVERERELITPEAADAYARDLDRQVVATPA